MLYLFLDNIRGFSRTVIPIETVNFLVGENSTGKSSILALLNLLRSQEFWVNQNFNLSNYEFGGYRDILSATANRNAKLSLGLYSTIRDEKNKKDNNYCYLLRFEEKDGLPVLQFFGRLDNSHLMSLKLAKGKDMFLSQELPDLPFSNPNAMFDILLKETLRQLSRYRNFPKGMPSRKDNVPFFFIISMLESFIKHKKLKNNELYFRYPFLAPELVWFAPIRSKPKRTYDGYDLPFSPEGEHTPFLLRKKLNGAKNLNFRIAIEKFGKESGLFNKIVIKRLGKDAAAPFELHIELTPHYPLRINSVGYGVSQILPLITEIILRERGCWFAIQQPEVHLHPRAQAALGDLIYHIAEAEGKKFIIETHSDFTIDRFRLNYKRDPQHKTKGQVLFFSRNEKGNNLSIIPFKEDGEYPENQPKEFRNFFLKEQMALLNL